VHFDPATERRQEEKMDQVIYDVLETAIKDTQKIDVITPEALTPIGCAGAYQFYSKKGTYPQISYKVSMNITVERECLSFHSTKKPHAKFERHPYLPVWSVKEDEPKRGQFLHRPWEQETKRPDLPFVTHIPPGTGRGKGGHRFNDLTMVEINKWPPRYGPTGKLLSDEDNLRSFRFKKPVGRPRKRVSERAPTPRPPGLQKGTRKDIKDDQETTTGETDSSEEVKDNGKTLESTDSLPVVAGLPKVTIKLVRCQSETSLQKGEKEIWASEGSEK